MSTEPKADDRDTVIKALRKDNKWLRERLHEAEDDARFWMGFIEQLEDDYANLSRELLTDAMNRSPLGKGTRPGRGGLDRGRLRVDTISILNEKPEIKRVFLSGARYPYKPLIRELKERYPETYKSIKQRYIRDALTKIRGGLLREPVTKEALQKKIKKFLSENG